MKKYIVPEFHVIEMETLSVIATSQISVSSESVDDDFNFSTDRKRGADWSAYEE